MSRGLQTSLVPERTPPSATPRLWHFRISHYNEKVRWALDHKRWPHTRTALIPGFHVMDATTLDAARRRMVPYFDRLESEIGARGYLVGDSFGIADLAAASVMTAIVRPPEFPYPLPEPLPVELVELRQSVADHPAFRWVLDVYARHRGESSEVAARERSSRGAREGGTDALTEAT